jgi:2-polyprenyl-3-methyl-5-hydroxy-6-metoxy-1,4-benzoquinol methylase
MKQRYLVPEKMDDPRLCRIEHHRALAGLRRINRLSGTAAQLKREVLRVASHDTNREWRILDVGCADGEIAYELSRLLSHHLRFTLTGWDMSEVAISAACARLESAAEPDTSNLRFEIRNLFHELEAIRGEPPFDIVYCTLLLHHFSDEDAVRLLGAMSRLARYAVIVDDLQRTQLGWWLAAIGCRVLSRSPVVHFDGPQSVRAAFSCEEALALASAAGLKNAKLRRHWPERYMLCWEAES